MVWKGFFLRVLDSWPSELESLLLLLLLVNDDGWMESKGVGRSSGPNKNKKMGCKGNK